MYCNKLNRFNVKELLYLSDINACRMLSKQLLQILENLCGRIFIIVSCVLLWAGVWIYFCVRLCITADCLAIVMVGKWWCESESGEKGRMSPSAI